jgi:hypothetical protein
VTAADGHLVGVTKVVDNGPDPQRYNIVLLGDGFKEDELDRYAGDVDAFTATLKATPPYDRLWAAINVHRVDVVSVDSGAADPTTCGDGSEGTGAAPRTFFDSTFCGAGVARRLLTCDQAAAKNLAKSQVPSVHLTIMLVNTSSYGGSGGEVATVSTNPQSVEIALHEIGHTAFGFADEYSTYQGCTSGEAGHDVYTGAEPLYPNITADVDPATIKWRALLTNTTNPFPTTSNRDCTHCDPQPNPREPSYVGAYDGAGYFHCKLYRPQYTCRMRELGNPYCTVCQAAIEATLEPFKP